VTVDQRLLGVPFVWLLSAAGPVRRRPDPAVVSQQEKVMKGQCSLVGGP
jgi:hypothetical protein